MRFKNSEEKLNYINNYLVKLMNISEQGMSEGKYNLALAALSAYCDIQYSINQVYTDKRAEGLLLEIAKKLVNVPDKYISRQNTVMFYDGFGLDLRGWAASYMKAITSLGYDVVYVAPLSAMGKIPHIVREVEVGKGKIEYIDMQHSYTRHIESLNNIINQYQPKAAFFYTTPNDVAGATVFDAYKGNVLRLQVDLTDHAYWIGVEAADYFLECRLPGASNAVYGRGICKKKILNLDCCLYINRDVDSTPLPFDIEKDKYIFSGGSLYKTLGDKELLFYKVISNVLKNNVNVKYLYAGEGDSTELDKLIVKYPGRVFHIAERSDFYKLFEHCVFLWNTYPMFGGLMMRFAANAKKVPLTLKHGKDHEGILNNQSELEIEFDTYEEVVKEAERLLNDEQYRRKKEQKLVNAVITEKVFAKNLKMIIEEHKTEFHFIEILQIDTREFQKTYIERIDDPRKIISTSIVNKKNKLLYLHFPELFVNRVINKVFRRR